MGILAPERRASLSAMATACLRLVTFLPLPDLSVPCFFSCITLWILRLPVDEELERPFRDDDFVAMPITKLQFGIQRNRQPNAQAVVYPGTNDHYRFLVLVETSGVPWLGP